MDQADNNSLTALLTKRAQVRFREIVNTSTERWAKKRIERTAWIWVTCYVKHCVNMRTVCAQPDGSMSSLLQSTGSSPYSWATGRNNIPSFLKRGPAGARWIAWRPVWRVASGEHWQSSRQEPLGMRRPVVVQGRRYQSLLGMYSVLPLRPVGRCEGWIQLKKAHCDSAWPIAANAAICAYLHPNEVGLSWARHT